VLRIATVALALVLLPASRADAHAFLSESSPSDGSVLASAPIAVRLQFSESIVLSATRIEVVDGDGVHYTGSHVRYAGRSDRSPESPVEILADLPALHRNTYRIVWETISSDDLHRTSGIIVFGIDAKVHAAGLVEPTPRPDEASLRWLLFMCVAGSLGGVLVARLCRAAAEDFGGTDLAAKSLRIAALSTGLGAVIAVTLVANQFSDDGWAVKALLRGSYLERWGLRELGFVMLAAGIWAAHRGLRRAWRTTLIAAGAASTCLGSALLGHAGSGAQLLSTRVLADAAHVAAAATWAGAVIVSAAVLVPRLRSDDGSGAVARAALRTFAAPAAACVGVMIATGLYLASGVVGSVDAALRTFYGRTLLLKVAATAVALLFGLRNHRRLRAVTGTQGRLVLRAEALSAAVVLALAATLTSGQPAREPQLVRAPTVTAVPLVDTAVSDLQEALEVRPNRPGRNVVVVSAFNTRRPAPAPIRTVSVAIVGVDGMPAPPLAAEKLADGKWSVSTDLTRPGATGMVVTVRRAGMTDVVHDFRWVVGGAPSVVMTPLVSNAPIERLLKAFSAASAAIVVLALVCWLARRGRRAGRLRNDGSSLQLLIREQRVECSNGS
jgi:copper transport protein